MSIYDSSYIIKDGTETYLGTQIDGRNISDTKKKEISEICINKGKEIENQNLRMLVDNLEKGNVLRLAIDGQAYNKTPYYVWDINYHVYEVELESLIRQTFGGRGGTVWEENIHIFLEPLSNRAHSVMTGINTGKKYVSEKGYIENPIRTPIHCKTRSKPLEETSIESFDEKERKRIKSIKVMPDSHLVEILDISASELISNVI